MDNNYSNIKKTTDYSRFKKLDGNRDVKSIKAIKESVVKIGQLPIPIVVNDKFEIIDGQHRFEAFKSLGLPIYYMIVHGIGIEEATCLNAGRKNWSLLDYVNSYALIGNKNYIRLVEMKEKFPQFTLQEIIYVAHRKVAGVGGLQGGVKEGNFVLTESECSEAYRKLSLIKPLVDEQIVSKIEGSSRIITSGLAWCMGVDGCDVDRLLKVFKRNYPKLRPIVTPDSYLSDISDIYNSRISNRIYFNILYREFSK